MTKKHQNLRKVTILKKERKDRTTNKWQPTPKDTEVTKQLEWECDDWGWKDQANRKRTGHRTGGRLWGGDEGPAETEAVWGE